MLAATALLAAGSMTGARYALTHAADIVRRSSSPIPVVKRNGFLAHGAMDNDTRRRFIFALDGALSIELVHGWFGPGGLFGLELFLFRRHYHIEGRGGAASRSLETWNTVHPRLDFRSMGASPNPWATGVGLSFTLDR